MKWALLVSRRVISNRLGQLLLVVHLVVVIALFAQKPAVRPGAYNAPVERNSQQSFSLLAGRMFHYHYKSTPMKILIALDMPGLFLGFIISLLLIPIALVMPGPSEYASSWAAAVIFLVGTSLQWLFVGYLLGVMTRWSRKSDKAE